MQISRLLIIYNLKKMETKGLIYLTPQQAQDYIPQEEDFGFTGLQYYTIVPSRNPRFKDQEGWEDVIYFSGRKKEHCMEGDPNYQYVYILENESMPGILKIGYSNTSPISRAHSLSQSTGVPQRFEVAWSFPCFNGIRLEQEVHEHLKEFRVSKDREFFKVSLSQAEEAISRLGAKYKFKD